MDENPQKIILKGRHLRIEISLDKFNETEPILSFYTLILFGEQIIAGMCWRILGNNLMGTYGNPDGIIQELLFCCLSLLDPRFRENGNLGGNVRKYARELGFNVGDSTPLYGTDLLTYSANVFFELVGNTLRIHYYEDLLANTDCPEFKGKHKGVVELPLKEFVEDVLKISKEYLEKYAPLIAKIRLEHGRTPEKYDYLWELYQEVKELYEKRFGSDNKGMPER
ncbi:hypothetical protein [Thermococcus gammatolerans]|uniref:Uncharacterized protein n=1 Tax=Thermococcus gammatolerans (strain DSM 15229 / JCM 11827 / EJ3) TaxID=593117 RepID=C5A572_THEGJ|nr:hypothetical protein [Thermococcus gammatolerans]ACS33384.1 Conserved hypothetical protein [Thermococcus gammatolerans EJ3]